MLTIEEIKKALDAGETVELECIDREGYEGEHRLNCTLLKTARLIAQEVDYCKVIIKNTDASTQITGIDRDELKYFRIKRPVPTFDDLIDVAVQAYKGGVIKSLKLLDCGVRSLSYSVDASGDENTIFSQHEDYSDGVDFISSLYTETFVIKEFSDTKILKSGAKAVLGNGEEVIFSNKCGVDDALWFEYNDCHSTIIPFVALKGATVTQKRGAI